MKLTRQTMSNIAIALVAAILFALFVIVATKGGNKDNGDLATVAPTTTAKRSTTTTEETTTTTETTLALTTTTVATATTVKTTATTAKPKVTTTTAHGACAHGAATETTDNKDTFSYGPNGPGPDTSSDQPGASNFPLRFTITTSAGTADPHNAKFEIKLTNNTACTATFGNNLVVAMTLHPTTGGDDVTFTVSPPPGSEVTDIKAGETIILRQERALPSGTFEATGACDINYG
jgi:hypothetical protein